MATLRPDSAEELLKLHFVMYTSTLPGMRWYRVHLKLIQICTPCHFAQLFSVHSCTVLQNNTKLEIYFQSHEGNVHQIQLPLQHILTYKDGRCIWRMTERNE